MTTLMGIVIAALMLTGCQFTGLNSQPIPFTKGSGSDDLRVTVIMENAVNLVPNSEVKFKEVTVGSVRSIEFDNWQAKLTIGVEKDVDLPSNTMARIGQKSLLGAEYLELVAPEEADEQLMVSGDVIGLDHTGRYPETEEVLSAVSLLLNGGGLGQIQTITRELNEALGGNEAEVRSLIGELGTFVGTLDVQKQQIIAAVEQLDALAAHYAADTATLDRALTSIPDGVDTLATQRADLTAALDAVNNLGVVVHDVVEDSGENLAVNLEQLDVTVGAIAEAEDVLVNAFKSVTWPFTVDSVEASFYGDYINFFATLDVSLDAIERDWLAGTPLEGVYSGLMGELPVSSLVQGNPLLDPLTGLVDGSDGNQTPPIPAPICFLDALVPVIGESCSYTGVEDVPQDPVVPPGSVPPATSGTSSPGLLDSLLGSLTGGK